MQIRLHGRGGQGIVTLAELLATAAFEAGYEAQAFPSFGSERMGAPVMSFCRVDRTPIRTRQPVTEPDVVLVCDATLLHSVEVFAGLRDGGTVLINSTKDEAELGIADLARWQVRVLVLPATRLARDIGGSTRANSVIFGACAHLLGVFSLEQARAVLGRRFGHGAQQPLVDAGYQWMSERTEVQLCAG